MMESDPNTSIFPQALQLALEAEAAGNLPIGAVIVLEGQIVARGKNAIWSPQYSPDRHAEVEALRRVPDNLWHFSRNMILYTTLEPCLMCLGAILLGRIGVVVYGSADPYGGASLTMGHMPAYFEQIAAQTKWIGPAYAAECDKLYARVRSAERLRERQD